VIICVTGLPLDTNATSNGQTEGVVNKLKLYWRQVRVAGRAKPDLLGARMLRPPLKRRVRKRQSLVGRTVKNRFYLGEVSYRSEWFPGQQSALVDPDTFERALAARVRQAKR
jgi:hypothetical protein